MTETGTGKIPSLSTHQQGLINNQDTLVPIVWMPSQWPFIQFGTQNPSKKWL